jgi:tetratricopeptide (TPR) repeat protein
MENYDESRIWYKKSIDLCKVIFGEDHPYMALGYGNYADFLDQQEQYHEAAVLYHQAYQIRINNFGEQHTLTNESLECLNDMYIELGVEIPFDDWLCELKKTEDTFQIPSV